MVAKERLKRSRKAAEKMPLHEVELTDDQEARFEEAPQKFGLSSIGETIAFLMGQSMKDMEPSFTGRRGPRLAVNNTRRKAPNK